MKTTTMCILSGLFGAMFAVACGAVSGVGDKVANADATMLQKKTISFDCEEDDGWDDFYERALNGEIIVSSITDNDCVDGRYRVHDIE